MKEYRGKILLIVAVVALGLYLLYPTVADYRYTQEIDQQLESYRDSLQNATPELTSEEIDNFVSNKKQDIILSHENFQDAREKRIKLGLDLQGGMYIAMEVNTAKLLERLAQDPDEQFKTILAEAEKESMVSDENVVSILANKLQEKGIRLSRYFGSIQQDDDEIIEQLEEQEADAVTRAQEIIRNRIDQYGVSEPSIQKQGTRRIIVELPGVANEEEAKRLLQGRALLEFKLVKAPQFVFPIMQRVDNILAQEIHGIDSTETDTADTTAAEDMSQEEFEKQHPFFTLARISEGSAEAFVAEEDKAQLQNYLNKPSVQNVIPDNVQFQFSANPITTEDGVNFYKLFMLNKAPELTGGVITDANANIDPTTTSPIVNMTMNSEGSLEWARITGANINKRLAIVLDNVVYSAPVVQNKISGGRSQISGMADLDEAKLLEIVLKAGALPAPVDIIEERTVGPSLGQDSINQGFMSTLIGFILVVIFMVIYYKKSGTVADLALFFTVLFIMGILAAFRATLTLPGIAGIILTIGMAVDANVLIFERIREELKTGKTVKAAIESGYAHSYSAIFDSNITTFFTAIILYQFGSGPIQGFALTLMIGIVSSLFSALFITRVVFDLMAAKGAKISVG